MRTYGAQKQRECSERKCRATRRTEQGAQKHRDNKRAEMRRAAPPEGRPVTNYVARGCVPGELPRRAVKRCHLCGGMPWARTNARVETLEARTHGPIVGPDGLCLGCGLPYAPEPEARGKSLLGSSAAQALPWAWQGY